ncbi:SLC13 family permease [Cytophagaceae bacterium ABcell3]|nr:SLC13 family permease [Cytophagaceae bacterium ABcell3]
MTPDVIIVLCVMVAAIILFATEVLSVDLVAVLIMTSLILSGVISPEEGVSGFSNDATITVAVMFVLSSALFKTGAVNKLGIYLAAAIKVNFWMGVIALMISVGVISAFINNTPVVAIFIPIVINAARHSRFPPSRLLMPLSFASMFGGVCTLIGTSTNILVSSIAVQYGHEPIGMFEMTGLGIIFFSIGILYMWLAGIRLIPERGKDRELTEKFGLGDYLTEIIILPDSPSVGKRINETPLNTKLDMDVIEIQREDQKFFMPSSKMTLKANDVLRVRCKVEKINEVKNKEGFALKSDMRWNDQDLKSKDMTLMEAVIAPNSEFEGRTLKQIGFKYKYHATALAIRHRGELMRERLADTPLRAGDTLLLEVKKENLKELKRQGYKRNSPFLLISELGLPEFRKNKIVLVLAILACIVTVASLEILPVMVAAIAGFALLVLTKCISMNEAYEAIDWKVIFLLGGALSLGIALENSGAAKLLSKFLIDYAGQLGPIAIVSLLYIISSLMTETMSNNASAVLLAPIAIAAANVMEVDARPFLMAITFAASASFMTPVGYQTNTMIYGAGEFKFRDFIKVGGPLNLIFWVLATFLIPVFFPF